MISSKERVFVKRQVCDSAWLNPAWKSASLGSRSLGNVIKRSFGKTCLISCQWASTHPASTAYPPDRSNLKDSTGSMGASLLSTMSNTESRNGIGGFFEVGVRTTMTGRPLQFFAAIRHMG